MKILQVCSYLYPALSYGGPARVVYDLATALSTRHQVTIYTSDVWDSKSRIARNSQLQSSQSLRIKYFKNLVNSWAFKFRFFTAFAMVSKFLQEQSNFKVVHLHDVFIGPQLLIAYSCLFLHKPYLFTIHGVLNPVLLTRKSFLKKIMFFGAKPVLNRAKYLIAVSQEEKEALINLGFAEDKIKVIYNGVSLVKIRPSHKFTKYKNKKCLTFLYLGKIHPQKGLPELILALSKIKISYQLLIAGPDDGAQGNLEKIIRQLKLKHIFFLGLVDDVNKAELFALANVFIYPSHAEAFSMAILEAMAAGLPVLISKACNFPDVRKYQAGYVVENKNLTFNLYQALSEISKNKKALYLKSKQAQNLVTKHYSLAITIKKYLKIYESAV